MVYFASYLDKLLKSYNQSKGYYNFEIAFIGIVRHAITTSITIIQRRILANPFTPFDNPKRLLNNMKFNDAR
jgi:hypothetical protein